ncbi:hypothetical protein DAHU10_021530 [Hanseniaspora uvarum]|nr:hypothetical protein DAHU10_021530 [Hanseniaspora uvarum]
MEVVSLHCTRYGVNGAARGKHQTQEMPTENKHKAEVQIDKEKGTVLLNGKIINKPHTVKHKFVRVGDKPEEAKQQNSQEELHPENQAGN